MTKEEIEAYRPKKGDTAHLFIGSMKCSYLVQVVAVDGNSVTVEERNLRKKEFAVWKVPDWTKPFEIDGKTAAFANRDGYFRAVLLEMFDKCADVSEITIGEKEED